MTSLDLFSTSPTDLCFSPSNTTKVCVNNAPFFAYEVTGKKWRIGQGCCNDWNCPKCGIQRAKQEYGRIVEGCRQLAKHNIIYFITVTCKGRELSKSRAEDGYSEWTSNFLDACYTKSRRTGQQWDYVHVTERQKRGHPHGHILTTFCPMDLFEGKAVKWETDNQGRRRRTEVQVLRSNWLAAQVERSGLGREYDISFVGTVEGASRYVAKYLFKDTVFTDKWPKGWKRVRYSQSFPKMPERETNAICLLSREDWVAFSRSCVIAITDDENEAKIARRMLIGSDTIVTVRQDNRHALHN